ncbi:hypothetical protein [Kitasatospora sp. LaBMicrA B282]|uniref:hypothetical protein n=1 Tax=Kitasatospora sp. LaBMicrA B282 TaxID=3420949 RepID=UPI003D0BEDE2
MSWVDETGRHEGFPVAVLADGHEPAPIADGRTEWWLYNGADGPRAVGVRAGCGCGWRGADMHLVDFGDDEATEGIEERTGVFADWEYHVEQAEGVIPRDVEQLLDTLTRRIENLSQAGRSAAALRVVAHLERTTARSGLDAVRTARDGLMTWEAIGRELGCSRQAAHERYARRINDQMPDT